MTHFRKSRRYRSVCPEGSCLLKDHRNIRKKVTALAAAAMLSVSFTPGAAFAAASSGVSGQSAAASRPVMGIVVSQSGNFFDFFAKLFHLHREKTKVKGVQTDLQENASQKKLSVSIRVTPAKHRKVILERYNKKEKEWKEVKVVKTGSPEKDTKKVTLRFPKRWKNRTFSTWRIRIPGSLHGTPYQSKNIHLTVQNREEIELSARSAVIMKMKTKQVLYDKDMNRRLPNASTTKMLTAIIADQYGDFSSVVTISKKTAKTDFSTFVFTKGQKFYFKDLYYAMLVESSNESAEAIAEEISGSDEEFSKLQRAELKKLGCRNTNFVNPHGLDDDNHYSTAYDLALIERRAMKDENFRSAVKTKVYPFREIRKGTLYKAKTTDELLKKNYKGLIGGKTGFTYSAKECFAGVYRYKGRDYITVVLGSDNRWKDTKRLFQYIRTYAEN